MIIVRYIENRKLHVIKLYLMSDQKELLSNTATDIQMEQILIQDDSCSDDHCKLDRDIRERIYEYQLVSLNQKRHEKYYGKVYLCVSIPVSVIFLIASIAGGLQFRGAASYDPLSVLILVLNIIGLIISTVVTAFNFPNRIAKHHASAGFFSELSEDGQAFIVKTHTLTELDVHQNMMLEKEKIGNANAPNLGAQGRVKILSELPIPPSGVKHWYGENNV